MNKKILILRACGLPDEKHECDNIRIQAELYGIKVDDYCPKTNEELEGILGKGIEYDYIYLSSHGDKEGFCNEIGSINYSWFDFGVVLCSSRCMKEDCIIMLSCCRGGLSQVAYDLFFCCNRISYIVGPRQSLIPDDMLIAFNVLMYNLTHRKVDPIVACEKIKLATDIRFVCYDRLETEAESAYIMRSNSHDEREKQRLNEAKNIAVKSVYISEMQSTYDVVESVFKR